MFPLALDLRGRAVLVLGGGTVGARKATQLLRHGASVTWQSDRFLVEAPEGLAAKVERPYAAGDLEGFLLVVAATNDGSVNDAIWAEARERATVCVVVDDRTRGDAAFMATVERGPVTVAVTTSGTAPALAQWVRDQVAAVLPSNLEAVALTLEAERAEVRAATGTSEGHDWRTRIEALVELPRATSGEEVGPHRDH